jgi:uncharacterized protein
MKIESVISSVKEVYQSLEEHLERIASKTGLKCPKNCSACCDNKDIEASPIEYYPLAEWLYQSGKVDEFLAKLDAIGNNKCVLYSPETTHERGGDCTQYEYRGLTCRLFGFGYRLDKERLPDLVTCKYLKENLPSAVSVAKKLGIKSPDEMPIFSNYFMQLYSIEPDLAIKRLPVNEAIRIAIENLYFHFIQERE